MAKDNNNEVLVRVEGVSKKFCKDLKKSLWYGFRDVLGELNPFSSNAAISNQDTASRPSLRSSEFYAVQDVSFELRRGECLGLIGRNGAGKTTLLKMLNGLIKPDSGSIEIRGRVGALIALGAGFNPILTGRENIYVNGAVLGLKKSEIDEKLEDIIEFAEIGEFIDTPVQSFSSGMQVRLGFAVATAMDPDVLILDEVLAVGDASFRHKCYHRIHGIIKNCAVILVSHSMDQIAAVSRTVALMTKGKCSIFNNPVDGIFAYNQAMLDSSRSEKVDGGKVFEVYPPIEQAKVKILNPQVKYGDALDVEVSLVCSAAIADLVFSFTAVSQNEQAVMNLNLSRGNEKLSLESGSSIISFKIEPLLLHDGHYRWNLWVGKKGSIEPSIYAMRAGAFSVVSNFSPIGDIPYLPLPTHISIRPETRFKANSKE